MILAGTGRCPTGFTNGVTYLRSRQLVALVNFWRPSGSGTSNDPRRCIAAGRGSDDKTGLEQCGLDATAYAQAVSVYLAFAHKSGCKPLFEFVRLEPPQYTNEVCVFATGNCHDLGLRRGEYLQRIIGELPRCRSHGQLNAPSAHLELESHSEALPPKLTRKLSRFLDAKVISTDPPYYDNIAYADLSDFFYVWLRHTLRARFSEPFGYQPLAVPKAEELVATPYRHGSQAEGGSFLPQWHDGSDGESTFGSVAP